MRDISLRELLDISDHYEGTTNVKKGTIKPAGVVVCLLLNFIFVIPLIYVEQINVITFNRMS